MSPSGELTAWGSALDSKPRALKLHALTKAPPEHMSPAEWELATWRAALRCLLLLIILTTLLSAPLKALWPLSFLSYALSWLWEYSLAT